MRKMIVLAAVAVAAACAERAPESAGDGENAGVAQTYAPELEVDLTQMTRSETGLLTQDITVGTGPEAQSGSNVSVHYAGWLPNGVEFDTSRGADPIEFPLGTRTVIAGWDEGLLGMRAGGRRRLVIPPHLGYGANGSGQIPPYATLVFDVELVAVDGVSATDAAPPDTAAGDSVASDTTSHDH